MLAHGFTVEQMVELIRAGLRHRTDGRIVAGPHTLEVARVRITQVGGGRSPSRDPPPNKHISPGWGSDELSKLWDAARSSRSATLVRNSRYMSAWSRSTARWILLAGNLAGDLQCPLFWIFGTGCKERSPLRARHVPTDP
jgi:hypothetical protein